MDRIDSLSKCKFIAHRLGCQMQGYPENSIENLFSIFNSDETLNLISGIELDIQFTADHIPVIAHDAHTGAIGDRYVKLSEVEYSELRKVRCGYRKSEYNSNIPWEENKLYRIARLEDLLDFLLENRRKLGDKLVKIETKSPILKKEDLIALEKLLFLYSSINENIIHLSFAPWNLKLLRELQQEKYHWLTQTDSLVDRKKALPIIKLWRRYIDLYSFGVGAESLAAIEGVNRAAARLKKRTDHFSSKRDAVNESDLLESIDSGGFAGIYTINTQKEVDRLNEAVSPEFFNQHGENLFITTDNPKSLVKRDN